MGPHDAHGFTRLNEHGLVVSESLECPHHGTEAFPIAGRLACASVHDEFFRMFGDGRVEVVLQHAIRGLLLPPQGVQCRAMRGAEDCGFHDRIESGGRRSSKFVDRLR